MDLDRITPTPPCAPSGNLFEDMRQTNEHGAEYWTARSIMAQLGYKQWRRFESALAKAITSCEQSGQETSYHFASAGKPISGGKGSVQVVADYHLSRFACYLIAQNGDSRKPEIANAQKYFVIQTRRQELSDQAVADSERLELRKQVAHEFRMLSGAARQVGVQSRMFGVFHDAGYKGMYNGRGSDAIKELKKIGAKENLVDCMGATELAANQFRLTQARDQLSGATSESQAIVIHAKVGREVRDAIRRIGGVMPEDLPPAENIKLVAQRAKRAVPKIELAPTDAIGLAVPALSGSPEKETTLDDL